MSRSKVPKLEILSLTKTVSKYGRLEVVFLGYAYRINGVTTTRDKAKAKLKKIYRYTYTFLCTRR